MTPAIRCLPRANPAAVVISTYSSRTPAAPAQWGPLWRQQTQRHVPKWASAAALRSNNPDTSSTRTSRFSAPARAVTTGWSAAASRYRSGVGPEVAR
ncbi:hypothetical protein PsYK624_068720 [Phanerochaete sordida]|uniref:Uncharacterized protein n=1 Tax=Phanerochaete sordida TaxID=48140 RepID=A0A9P3G9E5_9APHY|nr:hypothetical protein PsYK624_068720 [Phanerochaete sordida]